MAKIRPLTDTEQRAADMMRAGRDAGEVSRDTGLSRAQVAAAVDLAAQWDAVAARLNQGAERPVVAALGPDAVVPSGPAEAEPPARESGEPEVAWTDVSSEVMTPVTTERGRVYEDDVELESRDGQSSDLGTEEHATVPEVIEEEVQSGQPGSDDIAALLERAMTSGSLRAYDLAHTVFQHLGEIESLLAQEQQAAPLRDEIARLKAEIAGKENALAAIYGPQPVSSAVAHRPAAEPAVEPTVIDPALFFAREVRDWAREQKLDVRPQGRIANTVVEAYVTAHSELASA